MGVAIDGVLAAGNLPTWIIPASAITTPPSEENPSIPLAAFSGATTVKADCYMDWGGFSLTRTPTTRERQRMCQKVRETIQTGETIDASLTAVYDQQSALTEEVNKVYAALPAGAEVYIARAYGWDTDTAPTVAMKVDLIRGTVQARTKNEPANADEDLKVTATIPGSVIWEDVTLTAA